jgi:hypothetical protein
MALKATVVGRQWLRVLLFRRRCLATGLDAKVCILKSLFKILIIGFCILLRVILTVNNTFCFATID